MASLEKGGWHGCGGTSKGMMTGGWDFFYVYVQVIEKNKAKTGGKCDDMTEWICV